MQSSKKQLEYGEIQYTQQNSPEENFENLWVHNLVTRDLNGHIFQTHIWVSVHIF